MKVNGEVEASIPNLCQFQAPAAVRTIQETGSAPDVLKERNLMPMLRTET
jgi:hypothetical protein